MTRKHARIRRDSSTRRDDAARHTEEGSDRGGLGAGGSEREIRGVRRRRQRRRSPTWLRCWWQPAGRPCENLGRRLQPVFLRGPARLRLIARHSVLLPVLVPRVLVAGDVGGRRRVGPAVAGTRTVQRDSPCRLRFGFFEQWHRAAPGSVWWCAAGAAPPPAEAGCLRFGRGRSPEDTAARLHPLDALSTEWRVCGVVRESQVGPDVH